MEDLQATKPKNINSAAMFISVQPGLYTLTILGCQQQLTRLHKHKKIMDEAELTKGIICKNKK